MHYIYEGTEPYIFISYAHKDSAVVIPIIEKMQADGYRIWFDEGITPGREWDKNIVEHINNCFYFIAMISENYLASENCMDELSYVRDLGKQRLLVYIENVELPDHMKMRLSRLQAVMKFGYNSEADFYAKLYTADQLKKTLDEKKTGSDADVDIKPADNTEITSDLEFVIDYDLGFGSYTGVMKAGKPHGNGKYTYKSGSVYEGEFVDGKYNGKGKKTWPDGEVYEGDYVDGKHHGKGKYTWANGNIYEGDFVNDKRNGKGKYTCVNGDIYEGDFVDDKYHGEGKLTLPNGEIYEGDFKNGEKHGEGIYKYPDGKVYKVIYKNDKLISQKRKLF